MWITYYLTITRVNTHTDRRTRLCGPAACVLFEYFVSVRVTSTVALQDLASLRLQKNTLAHLIHRRTHTHTDTSTHATSAFTLMQLQLWVYFTRRTEQNNRNKNKKQNKQIKPGRTLCTVFYSQHTRIKNVVVGFSVQALDTTDLLLRELWLICVLVFVNKVVLVESYQSNLFKR